MHEYNPVALNPMGELFITPDIYSLPVLQVKQDKYWRDRAWER